MDASEHRLRMIAHAMAWLRGSGSVATSATVIIDAYSGPSGRGEHEHHEFSSREISQDQVARVEQVAQRLAQAPPDGYRRLSDLENRLLDALSTKQTQSTATLARKLNLASSRGDIQAILRNLAADEVGCVRSIHGHGWVKCED
jgi:hypothetical protein